MADAEPHPPKRPLVSHDATTIMSADRSSAERRCSERRATTPPSYGWPLVANVRCTVVVVGRWPPPDPILNDRTALVGLIAAGVTIEQIAVQEGNLGFHGAACGTPVRFAAVEAGTQPPTRLADRNALAAMIDSGLTTVQIAARVRLAAMLNDRTAMAALYDAGLTFEQIATRAGFSAATLCRAARRLGVAVGTDHPACDLTGYERVRLEM